MQLRGIFLFDSFHNFFTKSAFNQRIISLQQQSYKFYISGEISITTQVFLKVTVSLLN